MHFLLVAILRPEERNKCLRHEVVAPSHSMVRHCKGVWICPGSCPRHREGSEVWNTHTFSYMYACHG